MSTTPVTTFEASEFGISDLALLLAGDFKKSILVSTREANEKSTRVYLPNEFPPSQEISSPPNGTAVVNVALAFTYGRKGDDGKCPSQWINASLWGKQAEGLVQYITKGRQFDVTIKDLHIETYQGQNGQGSKLVGEIIDIEFAREGGGQNGSQSQQQRSAPPPPR